MEEKVINILWNRRNHQDNLIHTRLNWLIMTQSFLIIAFINAYDKSTLFPLLPSIPILGFLSTGLVYISIIRGIDAYRKVRERLWETIADSPEGVHNMYSKTLLDRPWCGIMWFGFLPCVLVPPLFMAFWSYLSLSIFISIPFISMAAVFMIFVVAVIIYEILSYQKYNCAYKKHLSRLHKEATK